MISVFTQFTNLSHSAFSIWKFQIILSLRHRFWLPGFQNTHARTGAGLCPFGVFFQVRNGRTLHSVISSEGIRLPTGTIVSHSLTRSFIRRRDRTLTRAHQTGLSEQETDVLVWVRPKFDWFSSLLGLTPLVQCRCVCRFVHFYESSWHHENRQMVADSSTNTGHRRVLKEPVSQVFH